MVESIGDAAQVADPVAIRVAEATRVDLVDRALPPPRQGRRSVRFGVLHLHEALHERERLLGDLAPAAVDGEGVPAIRDLLDLRHALVPLLPLEGRVRYRPRDGVVLLSV